MPDYRVWVERSSGLPLGENAVAKRIPGIAHEFTDQIDRPCQTIDTKTWRIAVEYVQDKSPPP